MKRKYKITKAPNFRQGGNTQGFHNDSSQSSMSDVNRYSTPDTEINSTMRPVPRQDANIEAEKGEFAITPGAGGIPNTFNIGGKRHAQGGTPLNLQSDSFIFSDYKKGMKITDSDILEEFGMPVAKKGNIKGYTPAEIAKKFDINPFLKILLESKSDNLDLESAELSIKNNVLKLGKLALIQESMKGFPQGIPKIAEPYLESVGMSSEDILPQEQPEGQPQQSQEQQQMAAMGAQMHAYNYGGAFDYAFGGSINKQQAKRFPGLSIAQQGGEGETAQIMEQVKGALEGGAQPQEVIMQLLQNGMPPESVAQIFVQLGMPQEQVVQVIEQVMSQGQEQPQGPQGMQPSEEEMMAMQQQQMGAPAPPMMRTGGDLKRYQGETGSSEVSNVNPWQVPGTKHPTDKRFTHSTKSGSTRWVTEDGKTPFQELLNTPKFEGGYWIGEDTLIHNDPRRFNIENGKDFWGAPISRDINEGQRIEAFEKTYGNIGSVLGDDVDPIDKKYYDAVTDTYNRKPVPKEDEKDFRFYSKAKAQGGELNKAQLGKFFNKEYHGNTADSDYNRKGNLKRKSIRGIKNNIEDIYNQGVDMFSNNVAGSYDIPMSDFDANGYYTNGVSGTTTGTTTTGTTTEDKTVTTSTRTTKAQNVPENKKKASLDEASAGDYVQKDDGKWYLVQVTGGSSGYTGTDADDVFGTGDLAKVTSDQYQYLEDKFGVGTEARKALAASIRGEAEKESNYKDRNKKTTTKFATLPATILKKTDDELVNSYLSQQKRNLALAARDINPEDFEQNGILKTSGVSAFHKKIYKDLSITKLDDAFDKVNMPIASGSDASALEQAGYWGYNNLIINRAELSPELQEDLKAFNVDPEGEDDEAGTSNSSISPIDGFQTNTSAKQLSSSSIKSLGDPYEEIETETEVEKEKIEKPKLGEFAPGMHSPYYKQDVMNMGNLLGQHYGINKYQGPSYNAHLADPRVLYYDDTRAKAANNEFASMELDALKSFAGPGLTSRASDVTGRGLTNAANIIGEYQNKNIPIGNDFLNRVTDTQNKQSMMNTEANARRVTDWANMMQNFDNARRTTGRNLTEGAMQAEDNRWTAQSLNQLYPQFRTRPEIGGGTFFTNGRPIGNSQSMAQSGSYEADYMRRRAQLKKDYPGMKENEYDQALKNSGSSYDNRRGRSGSPYEGGDSWFNSSRRT